MPEHTPARPYAVVGNPRPGSRTAAVAALALTAAAQRLLPQAPVPDETDLLDLGEALTDLGAPLGADAADRYAAPLARLHAAPIVVIATPVYKGSYTGLLKSFLDLVAGGALQGQLALPVVTVGGPGHRLAAEVHLRPLLVELGATVPTPALVLEESQLADAAVHVNSWLTTVESALAALARLGTAPALTGAGR